MLPPEGELAIALGIGEKAEHIGYGETLRAGVRALAAHAAIERRDVAGLLGQQTLVVRGEARGHGLPVVVQLVHVGHAGDGGVHMGVAQHPLQRGQHGALLLEGLIQLVAGLHAAKTAGHHFHGHDSLPRARGGSQQVVHSRIHGEVVGGQNHVHLGGGSQCRHQPRLAAMRAHPGKPDLTGLLSRLLGFEQFRCHLFRAGLAVQVPDVQVVCAEFAQAGIQVGQRGLPGGGVGLAGEHDVLALALERRADHALVVAALITAGGIEIIDPKIGRALDHAGVGGDHAAEAHRRDLQAGGAQGAIAQAGLCEWRSRRGGIAGARCGSRYRQGQAGSQKIAPR